MTQPVRLVAAEASPRLAPAQSNPEIKTQVLQPALATDVRTLELKLEAKVEAV